jgi:prolyl-tRNA synthetase
LRTTEFLWQEGYSAHATSEEANNHAKKMAHFYGNFLKEHLSIHCIMGEKSDNERFPGAVNTYSLEAQLGGKALQVATAHNLGDNFSLNQGINYTDKDGSQKNIYQTSWGSTTRMIGALVMAHGDEKGIVLPPNVAPEQVVIIPAWNRIENMQEVENYSRSVIAKLGAVGIRCALAKRKEDDRLGAVRYEVEKSGIPLQLIIGQREIESGKISYQLRHSGEIGVIDDNQLDNSVQDLLSKVSGELYDRSRKKQLESIVEVSSKTDLVDAINDGKMALSGWSGTAEDEQSLKNETGITIRIHPDDFGDIVDPFTGKTGRATIFAKAY